MALTAMLVRLPYVQRFCDRTGRVRHYLRKPGCPRVTLPGEPGTPAFLAAYHAAIGDTTPRSSRHPAGTFAALVISWRQTPHFRRGLRDSTRIVYARILARLEAAHGSKPVALLDRQGVDRILAEHRETPAAANHVLRLVRALMQHAVALGWRAGDPTIGIRRAKERGRGVRTWSEEDIAAYEARWPSGSKARLALALMLYTGQRRSDIVRMARTHLRDGSLWVRQQKTGSELHIPLHPDLRVELDQVSPNQVLFLQTDYGRAYTANGFYNAVVAWAAAAGLTSGASPHGLRKACATRLADAGCTAHEIMAITGHTTLSEVARYTKAADQRRLAGAAIVRLSPPNRLSNRPEEIVKLQN